MNNYHKLILGRSALSPTKYSSNRPQHISNYCQPEINLPLGIVGSPIIDGPQLSTLNNKNSVGDAMCTSYFYKFAHLLILKVFYSQ